MNARLLAILAAVHCSGSGSLPGSLDSAQDAAPDAGLAEKTVPEGPVSAVIGAAGGSVCLADDLCLEVPPGALNDDVEISMVDSPDVPTGAPEPFDRAIELLPDGLQFATPALLLVPALESAEEFVQPEVWVYENESWSQESVPQVADGIARARLEHFSTRILSYSCIASRPGETQTPQAWRVGDNNAELGCESFYILACDPADNPSFWTGPLDSGDATLHSANTPEPIVNWQYHRPQFDARFASGAVLYRNPVANDLSSDGTARARIFPFHLGAMGRAWQHAVYLKSGATEVFYRSRSVANVASYCAGIDVARSFFGQVTPLEQRPRTRLAPNSLVALSGPSNMTDGAHHIVADMIDLQVEAPGWSGAEVIEVVAPSGGLPRSSRDIASLPVACFGQYRPDVSACWKPAHTRGRFLGTKREGIWSYDTGQGMRAMVLGDYKQECGCDLQGAFPTVTGDQVDGTDDTGRVGDTDRVNCIGWESRNVCTDANILPTSSADRRRRNPANFGVVYKLNLNLENPNMFAETVDLTVGFRTEAMMLVVRRSDGSIVTVAPDKNACRPASPAGYTSPYTDAGDCRQLAFVLETFVLLPATAGATPTDAPAASRLSRTVEFTVPGVGGSPNWIMLMPRRLVSAAADGVQVFDRSTATRTLVADRLRVPRENIELEVKFEYPVRLPVPDSAVKLVRVETNAAGVDVEATDGAVAIDVIPAVADVSMAGSACTQNADCGEPDNAWLESGLVCLENRCQPARKARRLKIRPRVALEAGTKYWLKIAGATTSPTVTPGLRDLYSNTFDRVGNVLPGASADFPSEGASVFKWRFRTQVSFGLAPVTGSVWRNCSSMPFIGGCFCFSCSGSCGATRLQVRVTADPPLDPDLAPIWDCTEATGGWCSIVASDLTGAEVTFVMDEPPACMEGAGSAVVSLTVEGVRHTAVVSASCFNNVSCF